MTQIPVQEASLSRRGLAGILDLCLSAAFGAALARWFPGLPGEPWPPRYWNLLDYGVDVVLHHPRLWLPPLAVFLAAMLLWETLWTVLLGATPVARALGIQVRTGTGRRPGLLRSLWRSLLWIALSIPGVLGPAFGLLGRRRRMLHDILAGCLVVRLPVPALDAGLDRTGSEDAPLDPDERRR